MAPRRIRIELDETSARALHAALTAALPDLDGDRLAAARACSNGSTGACPSRWRTGTPADGDHNRPQWRSGR